MIDPLVSSILIASSKKIFNLASRLHAERNAEGKYLELDLLDSNLQQTLSRLQGKKIEDAWWQKISDRIGHQIIAPEFLQKPAIMDWLCDRSVANDLKSLAKEIVMRGKSENADLRDRLRESYAVKTGESCQLANGAIDVVSSTLVAGFLASISSDQLSTVGLNLEANKQMHDRFDDLERLVSSYSVDPITRKAHTNEAIKELSKHLMLRVFNPDKALDGLKMLFARIKNGDLTAIDDDNRVNVLYWTARLCAGSSEDLPIAKNIREEISKLSPDFDLSIIDALIAEADGDFERALRLLRDHDDAEPKSVIFGVIARQKGEQSALDWYLSENSSDDDHFFTAIGWKNWAICMMKLEKWDEALQRLSGLKSLWEDLPALAFVEGIINAAMLLQDEFRPSVLQNVPMFRDRYLRQDKIAQSCHARATECLDFVTHKFTHSGDAELSKFFGDWSLWLRLMDPNLIKSENARTEISQKMKNGFQAVELMRFAYTFDINFDISHLQRYLNKRKQLGGLDDDELTAEFFLYLRKATPKECVSYIDRHRNRLLRKVTLEFLTVSKSNALVRDEQYDRARMFLAEQPSEFDSAILGRLKSVLDARDGENPRKTLEQQYEKTGSLIDLKNLVGQLKISNDTEALRPLIVKLFELEPNVANAKDVVVCIGGPPNFDYRFVLEFLKKQVNILEQSDDLKAEKVGALLMAGRIQEAKNINDCLFNNRKHQDDVLRKVDIEIASGNWDQIPSILNFVWEHRELYDAETLMRFAVMTTQRDQETDRASKIAKFAIKLQPDNPQILASAFYLYHRIGRDAEADPSWMEHALEYSSPEEGPVASVNLEEIATKWLPNRQKFVNEIEQKWLNGEIPTTFAARCLNDSLARLLLQIPEQNSNSRDARRKLSLPIISGGRAQVELQENCTIGLDITSILVLSHLDLLGIVFDAFKHIRFAPDVMVTLFYERQEVQFHQPYLSKNAKEVRDLIDSGQLRIADELPKPPASLKFEVEPDLSELLELAKHNNGKVICFGPIYKRGSLMTELADVSSYDDLVLSTMDICTLLHDGGRIEKADFEQASRFLSAHEHSKHTNPAQSVLTSPLYIDQLALSYLQDLKLLNQVVVSCDNFRIHPNVEKDIKNLIQETDLGGSLVEKIERVKDQLRDAMEFGKASLLPYGTEQSVQIQTDGRWSQGIGALLEHSNLYDVLCIDDRLLNKFSTISIDVENSVPIACVLDILNHLVLRGYLTEEELFVKRHKIRESGYAFVPLESKELLHWLKSANVDNDRLVESVELRTIRQSVARINYADIASLTESSELNSNITTTCRIVIGALWSDESLTSRQVHCLSNWVWNCLCKSSFFGRKILDQNSYSALIKVQLTLRVVGTLIPIVAQTMERRISYTHWLERTVLKDLYLANSNIIELALKIVSNAILSIPSESDVYGSLFLAQLPEATRERLIVREPEFVSQCKSKPVHNVRIGREVHVPIENLFDAARTIFRTNKGERIRDFSGNEIKISKNSKNSVELKWKDSNSKPYKSEIQALALLSDKSKIRERTLRKVLDFLGSTAIDLHNLRTQIKNSPPDYVTLSEILDEMVTGVSARQMNLVDKLNNNELISFTDIVPPSIAYFEKFCGPPPACKNCEKYITEQLVPYRKKLLNLNFREGLKICCIGALHDDLLPGRWLAGYKDDTVWEALDSFDTHHNPFFLMSLLDIALYRMHDSRFSNLAEDTLANLLEARKIDSNKFKIYELLNFIATVILNSINLIEDVPLRPGFWRQLCAWMQAGFVTQNLTYSISLDSLNNHQNWLQSNTEIAGAYSELIAFRNGPMLLANRFRYHSLHYQIFVQLHDLKVRHEKAGRKIPKLKDIENLLIRYKDPAGILYLKTQGPLEGHKRPTTPSPEFFIEQIEKGLQDKGAANSLQSLMKASQYFKLSDADLERACDTVNSMAESIDAISFEEFYLNLEIASVVAAMNRDVNLANIVADSLFRRLRNSCEDEWIPLVPQSLFTLLQSAAANESDKLWFEWLNEKLTTAASILPAHPNKSLEIFLSNLKELEKMLPVESWFHDRAKSIAMAGS